MNLTGRIRTIHFYLVLLSVWFLFSCGDNQEKGFTLFPEGIKIKWLSVAENEHQDILNAWVEYEIIYTQEEKVLAKNTCFLNELQRDTFYFSDKESIIYKALNELSLGDSAHIILPYCKELKQRLSGECKPGLPVKIQVKMHAILLKENNNKALELLDEQALARYISHSAQPWTAHHSGIYLKNQTNVATETIEKSETVELSYTGRFLNDCIFDKIAPEDEKFVYTIGTQDQLIRGLELAVKYLPDNWEGEVIIPWNLAFGAKGSSTGLVKPYKSLIFSLKIQPYKQSTTL